MPCSDLVISQNLSSVQCGRGDRDVSPDWNEAGKTKIPDLFVGKGCPYYFPTPFCQDLHPVRRSDCHKKPGDVLP